MAPVPRALSSIIADIIERRHRLGVSQPQLAALAGVSWPALSRTERGLRDLRPHEAERLTLILDRIETAVRDAAALHGGAA